MAKKVSVDEIEDILNDFVSESSESESSDNDFVDSDLDLDYNPNNHDISATGMSRLGYSCHSRVLVGVAVFVAFAGQL